MARSPADARKQARSLRNRILRIIKMLPLIGLPIRRRMLVAGANEVHDRFAPQIREAKAQRNEEEWQELLHSEYDEASQFWDELRRMETDDLVRRARRQLVSVPARVWNDEENDYHAHWKRGTWGAVFLKQEAYDALAIKVREAERQTRKHRIDVASIVISSIALIASLWNLSHTRNGIGRMEQRIAAQEKQASEMRVVLSGLQRELRDQSDVVLALIRANLSSPAKTRPPAAAKKVSAKGANRGPLP